MIVSTTIIDAMVQQALLEDVGSGDISALLIPQQALASAVVVTRDDAVICGLAWVKAVFQQVDATVVIECHVADGDAVVAGAKIFSVTGAARSLLTAERSALNFLQLLSATATQTQQYVQQLQGTKTKLLDTRKTLPGYRQAQKYAVQCGGGQNHRMGLYDAFLIKENHIAAAGSIAAAIASARQIDATKILEVEVENLAELEQALHATVDRIMLDNFSIKQIKMAVEMNQGQVHLEVSGGIQLKDLKSIAALGIDFISVGAITKNITAIDFSMCFQEE